MSPSYQDTSTTDIAIVGTGIVGLTMAAVIQYKLRNNGLSVTLIDKGEQPQTNSTSNAPSRVVALSPHSIELLNSLGAWDPNAPNHCNYQCMEVWDSETSGAIRFDAQDYNLSHLGQQPYLGTIVDNHSLLTSLMKVLQNEEFTTYLWGKSVSGLSLRTQSEPLKSSSCKLNTLRRLHFDDESWLDAKVVIAADGGNSVLRQLANIPVAGWSCQQKAIVTTVETSQSHDFTAWQRFLPSGPLAFLPLGQSENHCSIVWSADNDQADALMQLSEHLFKQALAAAIEYRLGDILHIQDRYCFPLSQRYAKNYHEQQLVLIGDAAHTIHPLAGQGVNLGIADARTLAEEIDRAMHRKLPIEHPSILKRYQRQRINANRNMLFAMEGLKRLFGNRQLLSQMVRAQGLRWVDRQPYLKHWLATLAMGTG